MLFRIGLKGVPPAAKHYVFLDFGLKGVPPAAKNQFSLVFGRFLLYKNMFFQWISQYFVIQGTTQL